MQDFEVRAVQSQKRCKFVGTLSSAYFDHFQEFVSLYSVDDLLSFIFSFLSDARHSNKKWHQKPNNRQYIPLCIIFRNIIPSPLQFFWTPSYTSFQNPYPMDVSNFFRRIQNSFERRAPIQLPYNVLCLITADDGVLFNKYSHNDSEKCQIYLYCNFVYKTVCVQYSGKVKV